MTIYWDTMQDFIKNDLPRIPDQWVMFTPDMSIGTFLTEEEARHTNEVYLEWQDVEFITVAEFLRRHAANPDLEIEPFGG